jgi:flavorubredoxin
MATIAEVAEDTFRINLEIPGAPIDVSFFVIRDEQPTLVETGFRRAFPDTYQAVARVIDPATLRYVVVPHLEADESGALNLFLERAPAAVPVASPIGVATNLADLAIRDPLAVDGDSTLDLGKHRLKFLITPYVHQWDSMLAFDQTTRTLFSSDVFITPPGGPAVLDGDHSDAMLDSYRTVGIFASRAHLDAALDKIEAVAPATLACHHGSVKGGQITPYLRALREHDVTGVTEWNPMREPPG